MRQEIWRFSGGNLGMDTRQAYYWRAASSILPSLAVGVTTDNFYNFYHTALIQPITQLLEAIERWNSKEAVVASAKAMSRVSNYRSEALCELNTEQLELNLARNILQKLYEV
jgi:hypothetical protein